MSDGMGSGRNEDPNRGELSAPAAEPGDEAEVWRPPAGADRPTGPDSFPPSGPDSLAGVRARAIARVIDIAIVTVPVFVVSSIVLAVLGTTPDEPLDRIPAWVLIAWFVTLVGYETALVAWRGQTLGKQALGLRVARLTDGLEPNTSQAAMRICLPGVGVAIPNVIGSAVFALVYASSFWDQIQRGWHDKAAGTVVVATR